MCHLLGLALLKLTNGISWIVDTVKLDLIDSINKKNVEQAKTMLEEKPRGTWILVQARDQNEEYDKLLKEHKKAMKKAPKQYQKTFDVPEDVASDKAGYILFKDKNIVIFYSNNLKKTPEEVISWGDNKDAIESVRGLSALYR